MIKNLNNILKPYELFITNDYIIKTYLHEVVVNCTKENLEATLYEIINKIDKKS